MIARRRLIAGLAALAVLPGRGRAQGFAGLGRDAEGFALPAPDPAFRFPRDHGPHPDFRIEWWYVTATLTGEDGRDYGAQWTLFRNALRPGEAEGWASPQIWFAHAAATSADTHLAAETYARGGIGQAGVRAAPFEAWIDDWAMRRSGGAPAGGDGLDHLTVTARGEGVSYALDLAAEGPLLFHGDGGHSVKSPQGQASYYYSQPHYRASGRLALAGREVAVEGRAWLDREWSSQLLAETQTGWDWLALHLGGGAKLMVFRLRDTAGPDHIAATWRGPQGGTRALSGDAVALTPLDHARVAGRRLPVAWRVRWPEGGVDLTTEALNPRAWNDTAVAYWEGPIRARGSHDGRGYLEMTGYD